jgi:hypothetical protein
MSVDRSSQLKHNCVTYTKIFTSAELSNGMIIFKIINIHTIRNIVRFGFSAELLVLKKER